MLIHESCLPVTEIVLIKRLEPGPLRFQGILLLIRKAVEAHSNCSKVGAR